jgi:hypothetical protein
MMLSAIGDANKSNALMQNNFEPMLSRLILSDHSVAAQVNHGGDRLKQSNSNL